MTENIASPDAADAGICATAANAAVPQLAEEAPSKSTEGNPNSASTRDGAGELVRHPAARLHDDVFAIALPAVAAFAERKNVPIEEEHHPALLRHALEGLSRKAMRRVLQGNPDAVFTLQKAINHSLDVFAAMRMIFVMLRVEQKEAPASVVMPMAEDILRQRFANDRAPTMQIWPDVIEAVTAHYARMKAAALDPALLTLPDSARVLCMIQKPNRSQPRRSEEAAL